MGGVDEIAGIGLVEICLFQMLDQVAAKIYVEDLMAFADAEDGTACF